MVMLQAQPLFKDGNNLAHMVDPLLEGLHPVKGLKEAFSIAAMCVREQPLKRPFISEVVVTLNYLADQPPPVRKVTAGLSLRTRRP